MVYATHQQAQKSQKTTVCPLCGAVPWRDGLKPLEFSPTNKDLLGKTQEVHFCPACLAQLLAVAEDNRWLFYLELSYKRRLEQAASVVKVKRENHGRHKGRKK